MGRGDLTLGARFYWASGPNYYEAIRAYYRGLVGAGIVKKKANSERKNAVALSTQFNCWGAEVAIGKAGANLDEAAVQFLLQRFEGLGDESANVCHR